MKEDTIYRQAAIDAIESAKTAQTPDGEIYVAKLNAEMNIQILPTAQPTLRERALMLLLNWAVECDFGYDNFPEEYERYKDEIEGMNYFDGMIYIAEKEVERNG